MPTYQTLLHDTEQTLSTLLQPKLSCKYKLLAFKRLVLNVNNLLTTAVQYNDHDFLMQNKDTIYQFYAGIIAYSNSTIRLLSGTEESIKEIEKIIVDKALFIITPSALLVESSYSSSCVVRFSTLQEHIEFIKHNMPVFDFTRDYFTEIKPRINLVLKFFESVLSQPDSMPTADKQLLISLWQKFVVIIVSNLSNLDLLSTTLYYWDEEGDVPNAGDFAKKVIREIIQVNYIVLGLEKSLDLNYISDSLSKHLAQSVSSWLPEGLSFIDMPMDGHCLYNAVALYLGKEVAFLRKIVAEKIEHNIGRYRPYILLPVGKTIESYINDIKNTNEWAGDLEITILSEVLDRLIITIGSTGDITNMQVLDTHRNGEPIFVYYNDINHYDGMVLQDGYIGKDVLTKLIEKIPYKKREHINPQTRYSRHHIDHSAVSIDDEDSVTNDKSELISKKFNKCIIS